jgi:hypothetical protein
MGLELFVLVSEREVLFSLSARADEALVIQSALAIIGLGLLQTI